MVNPEFAVAIYYGMQILAATLVYCFENSVILTGHKGKLSALACHICCTRSCLRHDFAPQHNYDYACVAPAECLEAKPKGME